MKSLAALLVAFSVSFIGLNRNEDTELKDVKCVVSGANVKAANSSKWKEGDVYFCCGDCKKTFDTDSKKFASKANHQLVASKQFEQKSCPISGSKLNAEKTIEVQGVKIAFCCDKCKGQAASYKDDEKIEKLFADKEFEKSFAKPVKK